MAWYLILPLPYFFNTTTTTLLCLIILFKKSSICFDFLWNIFRRYDTGNFNKRIVLLHFLLYEYGFCVRQMFTFQKRKRWTPQSCADGLKKKNLILLTVECKIQQDGKMKQKRRKPASLCVTAHWSLDDILVENFLDVDGLHLIR